MGMLKTILIGFGIATVIVLILLWLITGGPHKIYLASKNIGNPFGMIFGNGTSTPAFKLPWQPDNLYGDLTNSPGDTSPAQEESPTPLPPEEELNQTSKQYDVLMRDANAAKTFGDPSPLRGQVRIDGSGAENDGAKE